MVDFKAMASERDAYRKFTSTPIGAAFLKFETATQTYWQQDGNDRCSDKRLQDLDTKCIAARKEFLDILMSLPQD